MKNLAETRYQVIPGSGLENLSFDMVSHFEFRRGVVRKGAGGNNKLPEVTLNKIQVKGTPLRLVQPTFRTGGRVRVGEWSIEATYPVPLESDGKKIDMVVGIDPVTGESIIADGVRGMRVRPEDLEKALKLAKKHKIKLR